MSTPDPYTRSYWRFADEYPEIYADDHAYALWSRLRDMADMAWPSAATLPHGVRKASLQALVDAELVFPQPGGRYRIRGMDKQRSARQEAARASAESRWRKDASAMRPHSERNATAMHIPSQAEPSLTEPTDRNAIADDEEYEAGLAALRGTLDSAGALPKPKVNGHAYQPTTDADIEQRARAVLADPEAPDWKRKAAQDQLTAMGLA